MLSLIIRNSLFDIHLSPFVLGVLQAFSKNGNIAKMAE